MQIKRIVLCCNDIKEFRKEFGYTQKDLADNLCVGKSFISQLESGRKELTENYRERLSEFFTILAKNKVEMIANDRIDKTKKRDEYLRHLAEQGKQKELIKEIALIRKGNGFKPSFDNVSCDMIWLTTVLNGKEKKMFENNYIYTSMRTDIEYYPRRSYQRPNIDFSYMFTIHCTDGKITVGYGVRGNDNKQIPKLVVQFNPNKVNFDYNTDFHMLAYCLGEDPIVTKIDYCRDYQGVLANQIVVTDQQRKRGYRREESNGVTHYIGNINCNGIRVYDKRAEMIAKDGQDIGYNVTRYEHRRQICRYESYEIFNKLEGEMETKYRQIKDVKLSEMNEHIGYSNLPTLSSFSIDYLDSIQSDMTNTDYWCYYIVKAILEGHDTLKNVKARVTPNQYKTIVKYVELSKVINLHISEVDMRRCNELFWNRYNNVYQIAKKEIETLLDNEFFLMTDLVNKEGKKVGEVLNSRMYDSILSEEVKELVEGVNEHLVVTEEELDIF